MCMMIRTSLFSQIQWIEHRKENAHTCWLQAKVKSSTHQNRKKGSSSLQKPRIKAFFAKQKRSDSRSAWFFYRTLTKNHLFALWKKKKFHCNGSALPRAFALNVSVGKVYTCPTTNWLECWICNVKHMAWFQNSGLFVNNYETDDGQLPPTRLHTPLPSVESLAGSEWQD